MEQPKRINIQRLLFIALFFDFIAGVLVFITTSHILRFLLPSDAKTYNFDFAIRAITFSLCIIFVLYLSGQYRQLNNKGLVKILLHTLGAMVAFWIIAAMLLINLMTPKTLPEYITIFLKLSLSSTTIILAFRLVIYSYIVLATDFRKLATYAILVGNNQKAETIYNEIKRIPHHRNLFIIGYISIDASVIPSFSHEIKCLGNINALASNIIDKHTQEVIIALESTEHKTIQKVLNITKNLDVITRITPDLTDIMEGTVKMNNIKSIPFVTIHNHTMPVWQMFLKTVMDVIFSLSALIVFLFFLPFIALAIKLDSKGPIFYHQERHGKNMQPFKMIKFRSMYTTAESNGPLLSSIGDERITRVGKILRQWHIDEIPQFINVLKGDMSIVGPRPERKFFIDQISVLAPHYTHLFKVKPGITSWGMVKYGYAENIEQMIERSQYDLLYLENMTLLVDLKIMAYTLKSIIIGDGK